MLENEEEEKKSQQQSVNDKSFVQESETLDEDGRVLSVGLQSDSYNIAQLQLEENYESMQTSQHPSAALISESHFVRVRTSNVMHSQAERQMMAGAQISPNRRLAAFASPTFEEGKEDLEEAAPEEHHPKEEHLQQIGVSVTMPSHHASAA